MARAPSRLAFGVSIRSDLRFPELDACPEEPGDHRPGIVIERSLGVVDGPDGWATAADAACYAHTSPSGVRARVVIDGDGRAGRIVIQGPSDLPAEVVRLLALGPGIAAWCVRAGLPVVHGNTVRLAGRDVLLTGPGGVGKSTLTAVLLARGAQLVADDLAVVDLDPPRVRPGFGRVKLWEDALAHLGQVPRGLPRIHPDHTKRGLAVPCAQEARPLGAVVVLERGEPLLEVLSGGEAVQRLLVGHRLPEILDRAAEASWLRACAAVARALPVLRVGLPGPLAALDAVAARIEASVGGHG